MRKYDIAVLNWYIYPICRLCTILFVGLQSQSSIESILFSPTTQMLSFQFTNTGRKTLRYPIQVLPLILTKSFAIPSIQRNTNWEIWPDYSTSWLRNSYVLPWTGYSHPIEYFFTEPSTHMNQVLKWGLFTTRVLLSFVFFVCLFVLVCISMT